jgi:hypothetical protein
MSETGGRMTVGAPARRGDFDEARGGPDEAAPERGGVLDEASWIVHGTTSGVIGAFLVALLFLGLDTVMAQPFWTPHALASALFLGETPAASPSAVLVIGYTVLHGAVFVSIGMLAAVVLPLLPLERRAALGVAVFAGLFVVLQSVFALLDALFVAPVAEGLRPWAVTTANLLAAAAMSAYLVVVATSRSLDDL